METSTQLDLSQFTGSMQFAKFGMTSSIMSEGVTHVANEMGAFWLVQDIDLYVRDLKRSGKDVQFVVATLTPTKSGAKIVFEDGNDNVLKTVPISFTDFDFDRVNGKLEVWVAPNEFGEFTLYLPSEH